VTARAEGDQEDPDEKRNDPAMRRDHARISLF
jgi:hypothetical protein